MAPPRTFWTSASFIGLALVFDFGDVLVLFPFGMSLLSTFSRVIVGDGDEPGDASGIPRNYWVRPGRAIFSSLPPGSRTCCRPYQIRRWHFGLLRLSAAEHWAWTLAKSWNSSLFACFVLDFLPHGGTPRNSVASQIMTAEKQC